VRKTFDAIPAEVAETREPEIAANLLVKTASFRRGQTQTISFQRGRSALVFDPTCQESLSINSHEHLIVICPFDQSQPIAPGL